MSFLSQGSIWIASLKEHCINLAVRPVATGQACLRRASLKTAGMRRPRAFFGSKTRPLAAYFFCGAAGGASLVGGTMFFSRM
jgi:hypothetical protein